MKKKGFTLVELLAVIVILAIIAVITTPLILNVIENAKKGAFKASALGVMESAELYMVRNSNKYANGEEIVFTCDGTSCKNGNNGDILEFKGEIPKGGKVTIQGKNLNVTKLTDGTYCATGSKENIVITKDCNGDDKTAPIITINSPSITLNSVTLIYSLYDDSGISSYTCKYGTSAGNYSEEGSVVTDTACKLENLNSKTTYYYQICAIDASSKKNSKCEEGSVTTKELSNPEINITTDPITLVNDYAKKVTVKVTPATTTYYVKTTRIGISSKEVSKSCGTGTNPETCTDITGTKELAENTWYEIDANATIVYETTSDIIGTITVVTTDGTNTTTATGTIPKIDLTDPTLTVGDVNAAGNLITINYAMIDNESGIGTPTCKYGTSDGNYTTDSTNITTSTCTLENLTIGETYYYQVCAVDNVGNQKCETGSKEITAIGLEVYFNPETAQKCDQSEYVNSNTGTTTGCMKWYIYNDDKDNNTYSLILDHNTTRRASSGSAVSTQLATDTATWDTSLNARSITADEIATITGNTSFDQATSDKDSGFYFDTNTSSASTTGYNYGWLYDRTRTSCTKNGCLNDAEEGQTMYGYWTSTTVYGKSNYHWAILFDGKIEAASDANTNYGVRPVITVSKSLIG